MAGSWSYCNIELEAGG